ncbi:PIG-L family deacetylase [Rhodocytophaga rosea]|uniref:PIG-L family deacetylase n=1 Tax=Rhodocytophaga rosea TaxID=2704465 RepID=A0A6C0GLD3_9BACT|nr:PIG-L family deacetylase [Rhodocytophaga rosea]QHT68828.1 PIG-L family deacetylase [Rhodocytophaga rosea]
MLQSLKDKKILVVVAHPDDELLGVGATIHKLIKRCNCRVRVIILGEGITSRANQRDTKAWGNELATHRKNVFAAQKIIGYESVELYNFPDNRFDTVALLDIVKVIEKEKSEFLPEIIFTHHGGDTNIDHRRTFEAVITASRPLEKETVKTIIAFETPSSTEWQASNYPNPFLPNLFFEVDKGDLDAKIAGMENYEFEKRLYPHPRSPEALEIQAKRWGVVVGKSYAEAFMLIRSII